MVIVDCFAGKGKYDDGKIGSPIIIADYIRTVLASDKQNKNLHGIFIESNYAEELKTNLTDYENCQILSGTFKENIDKILALNSRCNLFLYIDPYGIKCLDFQQFEQIKAKKFSSLEMILNFNSFGFLREGCRLLNLNYESLFSADQGDEKYEVDEANTIDRMNNIAHGIYWQDILRNKIDNKISMFEAEELFIKEYVKQIKTLFKHVVNIPIRLKKETIPKYRLIFGSNHPHGMIIMADNMSRSWKEFKNAQRGGQKTLFEYEFPDPSIRLGFDLREGILKVLKEHGNPLLLQDFLVELFEKYGIAFSLSDYNGKIKELEGTQILVNRDPPLTKKTGRKATSLDYRKLKITVKSKS